MTAPSELTLAKIGAIMEALREQTEGLTAEDIGLLAQTLLVFICSLSDKGRRRQRTISRTPRRATASESLH